ncbi:hypothetical protein ERX46_00980 [Brumimicrobium glaciale]|uniref:Uncharacterized protein n=1 Tax=Brumimicrobium glaciale TaxID=200475 RepID=A0A4Q4KQW2_9FLAO|nr:hypothetical protein [Brumimicrobium glaciale]RYM35593.1 hypothetical protein ERX46_00980 [Brumimicrobium glaciale]
MTSITLSGKSKSKLKLIEQLAKELGLTIEKEPNKETIKAMVEANSGKGLTRVKSFKEYKEATA